MNASMRRSAASHRRLPCASRVSGYAPHSAQEGFAQSGDHGAEGRPPPNVAVRSGAAPESIRRRRPALAAALKLVGHEKQSLGERTRNVWVARQMELGRTR